MAAPRLLPGKPAAPGERSLLQYEIFGTGLGGHSGGDGASGVVVHTANLTSTPIEILENTFPLRVKRFELVKDSAGAGEFRGGLCYRREYELLRGATINRRADRTRFASDGVLGGGPVSLAGGAQSRPAGEEVLPGAGSIKCRPEHSTLRGLGCRGLENRSIGILRRLRTTSAWVTCPLRPAEREYGVVLDAANLTVDIDQQGLSALEKTHSPQGAPSS